jgi:hypothetical protein
MRKSYRKIIPMRLKFGAAFVDHKDERKPIVLVIVAQWLKHWIQPEQGRRERWVCGRSVSCSSMTREFFMPERKRWIAACIHFTSELMLRLNSPCMAWSRYK